MDNSNQKPGASPNRLMELMMQGVLQKHGITRESVNERLSEEQKKLIVDLLEELKHQADALVSKNTSQKTNTK
ncbi:hypothetical protein [Priestia megaterium]|uniref:hypothetical protein n=1 Tax=Priestia megaterium TaxID=1404 RepID=UPI001F143C6C|nr:hypothetical protein [Priestia megaterium]UMZ35843.1 hypothetical protein MGJ28_27850 [Priestia megaterium]